MKTTRSKRDTPHTTLALIPVFTALAVILVAAMYGVFRIGCWLFELSMPTLP